VVFSSLTTVLRQNFKFAPLQATFRATCSKTI